MPAASIRFNPLTNTVTVTVGSITTDPSAKPVIEIVGDGAGVFKAVTVVIVGIGVPGLIVVKVFVGLAAGLQAANIVSISTVAVAINKDVKMNFLMLIMEPGLLASGVPVLLARGLAAG